MPGAGGVPVLVLQVERRHVTAACSARRARLAAEVARLFALQQGKYGAPRITADLRDAGWRVSENTVAAVMREQHLAARSKKKRRATTRPGKGRWRAPDLVKRDFPADRINRKWFGDGTEIETTEGKLHLASVMDVASRRVVGFALGEHHDAQLAYGALAMAVAVRGGQCPASSSIPTRAAKANSTGRRNTSITEVCDGTGEADAAGARECSAAVGGGSGVAAADAVTGPA